MSHFEELLKQAKKEKQNAVVPALPSVTEKAVDTKVLQALPSGILLKKGKSTNHKVKRPENEKVVSIEPPKLERKPKSSFRDLQRLAKGNEPEGLLRKPTDVAETIQKIPMKPATHRPGPSLNTRQTPKSMAKTAGQLLKSMKKNPTTARQPVLPPKRVSKKSNVPTKFIKLNTQKRDLTPMEDIYNEIQKRKGGNRVEAQNDPRKGKPLHAITSTVKAVHSKDKLEPVSSSRPKYTVKGMSDKKVFKYSTESEPNAQGSNYSSIIQDIFKRPGRSYDYSDDYSSDDMEANFDEMEREEAKRQV